MDIVLEKVRENDKYKNFEIDDLKKIYDEDFNDSKLETIINESIDDCRKKIAATMNNTNICLLTGNGSSIYAGTQATTKFDLSNYFEPLVDEEEKIYKLVNNNNVEKVLSSLILLKNYNELSGENNDLINEKIRLIEEKFIKDIVVNLNYNNLSFHDTMIRKFKNLNILHKTTIFTLNYDLAFEYSFDKIGITYNNGFNGFINRIFNGRDLENNNGNPTICKLHGSLNWHVGDNSFDIKEIQPVFLPNGTMNYTNEGHLIYPTSNKFVDSQNYPFSELMRVFLNKISNQKCTLFILGYKFEDTHVNDIIMKSLMNPNLIINIFNYNANNAFVDKIKKISAQDDRVNYYEGEFISDFRTFSKYMLPVNEEKSDIEKIREILLGGV